MVTPGNELQQVVKIEWQVVVSCIRHGFNHVLEAIVLIACFNWFFIVPVLG